MSNEEQFEFIRAIVDCGELRWESKLVGNNVVAKMRHDDDIEGYSDDDIKHLTVGMLGVPDDQIDLIEVIYC